MSQAADRMAENFNRAGVHFTQAAAKLGDARLHPKHPSIRPIFETQESGFRRTSTLLPSRR